MSRLFGDLASVPHWRCCSIAHDFFLDVNVQPKNAGYAQTSLAKVFTEILLWILIQQEYQE